MSTPRRRALALLAGLAAAFPLAGPVHAQSFPDHPITLVTGFAPGGSTDIAARFVADRMQAHLPNGRIVVENRPGASGVVAADWLRRQPADGYTIMLIEASSHSVAPNAIRGGTRYNPIDDFTPIAIVGTGPLLLIASNDFPARDAVAAVRLLRESPPDRFTYASSGVGSIPQLAAELLRVRLGTHGEFPHAAYRSGGQMVESIARNETGWGIAVLASAAQQVRDGRVRGLAVTGPRRTPAFPDIPTLAEGALPGFEIETYNAIIGPRGIPGPVQAALNRAINAAIAEPGLRERLQTAGVDAVGPNTPEETRTFLVEQLSRFQEIVRSTGVTLEP
ncbi:tripartite tricarboxylate transporter substrate binding protein [Roseomonas sp. NAR14]|uniref:Tripartite tricarboxylate transporter substrate binding protein n=1 Tax=Roseomonas acroporae TaxID=2937791 RepID=A0A9X1YEI0_9PROT|nr:tripartite tricarboxylate transporter substrate binding protein [Roseomonas acroporae]MCK8787187.1 tripartite tricarboxylate transporter substrate binding protein [Roseomonas acroporae]